MTVLTRDVDGVKLLLCRIASLPMTKDCRLVIVQGVLVKPSLDGTMHEWPKLLTCFTMKRATLRDEPLSEPPTRLP